MAAEGPMHTFFWNGQTVQEVGQLEVLAWLPTTSSVIGRSPAEGGTEALVAVHLPDGNRTQLTAAAKIMAAAPLAGRQAVLAAVQDAQGARRLVAVRFDGQVTNLLDLEADATVGLATDPTGELCALSRTFDAAATTVLLKVDEHAQSAETVHEISECPKAVPVAVVPTSGGQAGGGGEGKIARIRFFGNTVVSEEELSGAILARPGQVIDGNAIRRDVARLAELYQQKGYLVQVTAVEVDAEGVMTFRLSEVRIAEIVVEGLRQVKQEAVLAALGIKPGDLFQQAKLAEGIRRVLALPGVQRVETDLRRGEAGAEQSVTLVIKVDEG